MTNCYDNQLQRNNSIKGNLTNVNVHDNNNKIYKIYMNGACSAGQDGQTYNIDNSHDARKSGNGQWQVLKYGKVIM
jgi:hypothetical protein